MSTKKMLGVAAFTAALAGGGLVGALLGAPAFSGAQESGGTTPPSTQVAPAPTDPNTAPADPSTAPAPDASGRPARPNGAGQPAHDPKQGGHVGANGTKEELLTGDTADKVTAAALAANPGATIERVETDADGATYEAHIVASDGSHKTVLFDANVTITGTESGPGPH